MADIKTEIIDGKEITIVEDSSKELRNYLDEAQKIEQLDESEQSKALEDVYGSEENEQEPPQLPEKQEEAAEKLEQTLASRSSNSARANSDVVMAMAIACKAAEESAADSPCYVVHGAKVMCSMGSREARLVVPMDYGVLLKEKPQMVIDDYQALENVKCFGNCFSAENPNMEQAAIDAANQYNESTPKTFWGKVKAFFIKPKKVESVSEELKAACICECTPLFVEKWTEGAEKNQIDSINTLVQTGILICEYGGIIRIIDNGQDG